jgi:hypothetical protein
MNQRAPDVALDLGREIQSKSRLARFIPFDRFVEFHLGFRVVRGC